MIREDIIYTYEEIIDTIEYARRFGKQPGVEVTARALEVLGHPEDGLKFVHVAGTNGKGSVCAFLGSIMHEAGLKAGVFTSPHLIDFKERIVVDGKQIPEDDVERIGNMLLSTDFGVELTMFDYCLLMAVLYFKECGCDIAIMETGLGGRLDSTNALGVPEVAVITRIGYDHMAILGNTLEEIAGEKAGILKSGSAFVMGPQEPEAEAVLLNRAGELGLKVMPLPDDEGRRKKSEFCSWTFIVNDNDVQHMRNYHLRMIGEYQLENAAIARKAAQLLLAREQFAKESNRNSAELWEPVIRKGLENAVWPGRMQIVSKSPFLLVDGAHNSNGVAALRRSLEAAYPGEKFHFLMGVMEDKDYTQMVDMMLPVALDFTTVTPQSQRALAAQDLAEYIRTKGVPADAVGSVDDALDRFFNVFSDVNQRTDSLKEPERADSIKKPESSDVMKELENADTLLEVIPERDRTVAFGSLYFIGELLSIVNEPAKLRLSLTAQPRYASHT